MGRFIRIQRINEKILKIVVRNWINPKKAKRGIKKARINKRFPFKGNKTLQGIGRRWSRKESNFEGKRRTNNKKTDWKTNLIRIKKWIYQAARKITKW